MIATYLLGEYRCTIRATGVLWRRQRLTVYYFGDKPEAEEIRKRWHGKRLLCRIVNMKPLEPVVVNQKTHQGLSSWIPRSRITEVTAY